LEIINNIKRWVKTNKGVDIRLPERADLDLGQLRSMLLSSKILHINSSMSKNFSLQRLSELINKFTKVENGIYSLTAENISIRIGYLLIELGERKLARQDAPFTAAELYDVDPRFVGLDGSTVESMVSRSAILKTSNGLICALVPFSKTLLQNKD